MSSTKIDQNTTNILNCYFRKKFTFCHIKPDIEN